LYWQAGENERVQLNSRTMGRYNKLKKWTRRDTGLPGRRSVLVVAYHFAPENVSGTHRSLHFARSLHNAGFKVFVLTVPLHSLRQTDSTLAEVFPYPSCITRVDKGGTVGGLYISLKRWIMGDCGATTPSAAEVPPSGAGHSRRRTPSPLDWLRRQVAAWDVLPDQQRAWYSTAVRAGLKLARRERIDVVLASGPPWTGVRVAQKLSVKLGCRLILDFRDPWTANSGRQTRYGAEWCHALAKRWERQALGAADLVLFNSPGIMAAATDHYRTLDWRAVVTILNGSDAPRRAVTAPLPAEAPLPIRHFGNLYRGRSVLPVVEALRSLLSRRGISASEVRIELFGRAGSEVDELLSAAPVELPVDASPTIPYAEAVRRMTEPCVLLVPQPPNLNIQIPTKLYDYLCTGNPVLVLAREDSSTWSVARRFPRCRRLDHDDVARNAEVLDEMLEAWRSGLLMQERAADDTRELSKAVLGEAFVRAVDAILRGERLFGDRSVIPDLSTAALI